jgi:hypothetical protein
MVDDLRRPVTIPRSPESRSWPASARSAPFALIQNLQWLREWVLERLDSLETLARQRSASAHAAGEVAGLERTLELKRADLEVTERRLCAQAERQEKEWSALLTQLEADRRLLAEAWERVERERIESLSASEPHPPGQGPQRGATATLPHAASLVPVRSAAADSDPNHPVAQAVLRQFQTLGSDVRRNAEERRDSR